MLGDVLFLLVKLMVLSFETIDDITVTLTEFSLKSAFFNLWGIGGVSIVLLGILTTLIIAISEGLKNGESGLSI